MEKLLQWFKDGWGYLLGLIGVAGVLWGGIKIVKEASEPIKEKRQKRTAWESGTDKRLDKLEEHDNWDMERFDAIDQELSAIKQDVNTRFDKQEKTNQATMAALTAIINHMIDGNGIQGLKDSRDELLRYIINK